MTRIDFDWRGDEISKLLDIAIDEGVGDMSATYSQKVRDSMPGDGAAVISHTKTGRNRYRASNPGQPPGVRTGRLRSSISFRRNKRADYSAGTNVEYAEYLERGTSKMPARPFLLSTALDKSVHRLMVRRFIYRLNRRMTGGAG